MIHIIYALQAFSRWIPFRTPDRAGASPNLSVLEELVLMISGLRFQRADVRALHFQSALGGGQVQSERGQQRGERALGTGDTAQPHFAGCLGRKGNIRRAQHIKFEEQLARIFTKSAGVHPLIERPSERQEAHQDVGLARLGLLMKKGQQPQIGFAGAKRRLGLLELEGPLPEDCESVESTIIGPTPSAPWPDR